MHKLLYLLGLLLGFTVCGNTLAQSLDLDFSKAKFKPALLENKSPICTKILSEAQKAFFETHTTMPSYFQTNALTETPTAVINNKKIGLRSVRYHGCGGGCETYQILPQAGEVADENKYLYDNDIDSSILEKLPPRVRDLKGMLYPAEDGGFYFYSFTDVFQVHQLTEDATWKHICTISTDPDKSNDQKLPAVSQSLQDIESSAQKLTGNYGSCGSMAWGRMLQAAMHNALQKLSYKPWEIYSQTNQSYMSFWEDWSQQGIYENNAYRELRNQFDITQKVLSNFYQKNFGWNKTQSDHLASNALNAALTYGFVNGDIDNINGQAKKAILAKQTIDIIKHIPIAYSHPENLLATAITYPEAITFLLDEGFNPNEQNAFGKTPLMYAAQYNQIESAKALLKKGANSNLFTIIPADDCSFTLSFSKMTALHYAARYASAEMIKLLLNSGANPYAATSEENGGRPIDWLHKHTNESSIEKTPNISQDNISEIEKLLTLPSNDEAAKKSLNFNLAAEQAFQKGKLEEAYNNTNLALGLDEKNERALSNLSLILIKQNKLDEALEASNTLISKGKDKNQIANAWFNYGLICEKSSSPNYVYYNGHTYCGNGIFYPYIESFKAKQTTARANKIINLTKANTKGSCEFSNEKSGLITVIQNCSDSYNDFCVLHSKDKVIDLDTFSLIKQSHSNVNDLRSPMKISVSKPTRIIESIAVENYQLTKLAYDGYGDVQFGDKICTHSAELLAAPKFP